MKNSQIERAGQHVLPTIHATIPAALLLLGVATSNSWAQSAREPELPTACGALEVPAGNKVWLHVYAEGVQIYRWNGSAWAFVAPAAILYANAEYDGEVGTHFAGPTWQSNSGSEVVGERVAGCTPDATAIPWLLLQAVSAEGPGVFHRVTYIQRVNTVGGLAPATPGSFVGEESQVPYTAEYFFYRPAKQ